MRQTDLLCLGVSILAFSVIALPLELDVGNSTERRSMSVNLFGEEAYRPWPKGVIQYCSQNAPQDFFHTTWANAWDKWRAGLDNGRASLRFVDMGACTLNVEGIPATL